MYLFRWLERFLSWYEDKRLRNFVSKCNELCEDDESLEELLFRLCLSTSPAFSGYLLDDLKQNILPMYKQSTNQAQSMLWFFERLKPIFQKCNKSTFAVSYNVLELFTELPWINISQIQLFYTGSCAFLAFTCNQLNWICFEKKMFLNINMDLWRHFNLVFTSIWFQRHKGMVISIV